MIYIHINSMHSYNFKPTKLQVALRSGIFDVNLRRMMNTEFTHIFVHHVMTGCMLGNIFPELPSTSFSLPGLVQVIQGGEPPHLCECLFECKAEC